jgi:hypothetical protein
MDCKCGSKISTIRIYTKVNQCETIYICPDCGQSFNAHDLRNKILIGDVKPENYRRVKLPKCYN